MMLLEVAIRVSRWLKSKQVRDWNKVKIVLEVPHDAKDGDRVWDIEKYIMQEITPALGGAVEAVATPSGGTAFKIVGMTIELRRAEPELPRLSLSNLDVINAPIVMAAKRVIQDRTQRAVESCHFVDREDEWRGLAHDGSLAGTCTMDEARERLRRYWRDLALAMAAR